MRKITFVSFVCAFILVGISINGYTAINKNTGTAGLQVLKVGLGARSMAMGGAYSAVSDDVTGIYHNPAGLTGIKNLQLAFQHLIYFGEIQYTNFSIARPVVFGTLGLSVSHLWMDKLKGRDTETGPVTEYDASDTVITLGYARELTSILSAGFALKVINSKIEDASALAYAGDFSVLINILNGAKVALVLQNLGTEFKYEGDDVGKESDKLPQNVKLGVSYPINDLNLAVDINIPNDNKINANVGVEYRLPFNMFQIPLRVGYKTLNDFDTLDGISAGFGVTYQNVTADFSWSPYGGLGDTFRTSILLKF